MSHLWKKLDLAVVQDPPVYLDKDDECVFAREYISKGGYQSSEANSLVSNFKKDPGRKGRPEWSYKKKAARQFARELSDILGEGLAIAIIPSSKLPSDSEYDPRFDYMLEELVRLRGDLSVQTPFRAKQSMTAIHISGQTRTPEFFHGGLEWCGIAQVVDTIALIDDVVTSGAHFKACKRMLLENSSIKRIVGVFWARTVWPHHDTPA